MSDYVIGSFNTHNFSGVGKHDLNILANIIRGEGFDIVALQETLRPEALNYLLLRLSNDWNGTQESPISYKLEADDENADSDDNISQYTERKNAAKGFSFLWNARRIRECSKDGRPEIFNMIKKGEMARNPYYARFTPTGESKIRNSFYQRHHTSEIENEVITLHGPFFEIRLINIHLWWGSGSIEDRELRKKEYELATGEIHTRISKHRYGNNMPSCTIILGDYNMTLRYLGKNVIQDENIIVITEQAELTTLKKKESDFSNDYDHFSYDTKRFSQGGITVNIGRINSVTKYCSNDFEKHRAVVSDHVPVKIELSLR